MSPRKDLTPDQFNAVRAAKRVAEMIQADSDLSAQVIERYKTEHVKQIAINLFGQLSDEFTSYSIENLRGGIRIALINLLSRDEYEKYKKIHAKEVAKKRGCNFPPEARERGSRTPRPNNGKTREELLKLIPPEILWTDDQTYFLLHQIFTNRECFHITGPKSLDYDRLAELLNTEFSGQRTFTAAQCYTRWYKIRTKAKTDRLKAA